MKNKNHIQTNLAHKRWIRLGFSLTLAMVLLLIPFTAEIIIRLPDLNSSRPELLKITGPVLSAWPVEQQTVNLHLPFGVSLVRADGGLTITKSAPSVVDQGGVLTYTLTISNFTSSDLGAGYVADSFSAEVSCGQKIDPPSGWSSNCSGGGIAWTFSKITDGTTVELIYELNVTEPLTDGHLIVNNDYTVSESSGAHSDFGPPVTTTVRAPTWAITKTVSSNSIQPNQVLTYTITVTNVGSLTTEGTYNIADTVPANTTVVGISSDGAVSSNPPLWAFSAPLVVGASNTVTYSVRVNSPLPGGTLIVNDGYTVYGGNVYSAAISDSITVTVDSPVTLSVVKTAAPDPVSVDDVLTYTLTVFNNSSTGPAEDVVITDVLPSEVTYQSAGFVGGASGSILNTDPVVWALAGAIPENGSVQVTVTAKVDGMPLPTPPVITNATYSVSARNAPLVFGTAITTELKSGEPVTVTVIPGTSNLSVCDSTMFTVTVVDQWNNYVSDVPVDMVVKDNNIPQPPPDPPFGDGVIIPTTILTTNANGIVNAYVQGTDEGNISVVARVLPLYSPYGQTGNINFALPAIPTAITTTVVPTSVFTGETAVVTATVSTCLGPVADGQVVDFYIPPAFGSVNPVSSTTTGGVATTTVTAGSATGTTAITATAGSIADDTPFTIVGASHSLTITKTADPSTGNMVESGGTIAYTIRVTNTGNIDEMDVFLTDTLPLSVSYVSLISSTTGSGSISGPIKNNNVIVLSISKLEPATILVASIEVTVTAAISGTMLENYANAKSSTTNLITSNIVAHRVYTSTGGSTGNVYLPIIIKN